MANTSIDGLVSGLNTSALISQLMQVEAAPQTALKNKVTVGNKAVSAYQNVNTKMAAVVTAAKALGNADTWGSLAATSSSDAAVATTTTGGMSGSITFKVDRLAAAHTVMFGDTVSSTTEDDVMSVDEFDVLLSDGSTATVSPANRSLQAVVNAINSTEDAAYRAAAVQVAPGEYTLQLTAVATGADAVFADVPVDIELGTTTIATQGTDARILVGTTNPYAITSASNTFTDVLPGLTLNVNRAQGATDAPVTVKVSSDTDAITAKAQSLVDSVNAALSEITAQSRQKNGTVAAGPLAGDSALRKLSGDLLSAVSGGAGDLGSLSQVGITLTRGGTLAFDAAKFKEALAADPAKTRSFFDTYTNVPHAKATTGYNPGWDDADGVARKLETIGLYATEGISLPNDPVGKARQGILAGLIQRRTEAVRGLTEQVEAWDVRLELRQTALQRQFSTLETSLSKL
ncbi:MAG TPA: flagellar filament capping protein FliD, partial [Micromonosporaceae bacterium]|nr:flagellar filament capping protein FliD [Micromonosporaceae bacterium]